MGNLIMLDDFDLGELGASLFPGPEGVRAKDAKDAKVRKVITGLSMDHPVLFRRQTHSPPRHGQSHYA